MRARRGLPAVLAALGVALTSACTAVYQGGGPPTVMVSSPFGPPRVMAGGASAAPPGGRLAMPPANLEPPQPSAPTAVDRSGV